jgi:pyruvate dehydrogenase E1 component
MAYLHARREKLGGYLPARLAKSESLATPGATAFAKFALEAAGKEMSTTVAYVRMVGQLLKDPVLGKRLVPIIADEARTFGMADLFRQIGIYSPIGQLYQPEDSAQLSYYKEAVEGQILEEGINEAGAIASWVAGRHQLFRPRAADAADVHLLLDVRLPARGRRDLGRGDSRSRGFLFGATPGARRSRARACSTRTAPATSSLPRFRTAAPTIPCFAYELAVILEDGMRRMLADQEDVFYYVTLMNESYAMPSMPEGSREGILRGMHRVREAKGGKVRLLGAGTILNEVLAAAELLQKDWDVAADRVFGDELHELRREGMEASRHSRVGGKPAKAGWIETQLPRSGTPVIAATDYVSAVADLIRPWIADRYVALGTDGFGRSDTRANLRKFFEVDRHAVVVAALHALGDERAGQAVKRLRDRPELRRALDALIGANLGGRIGRDSKAEQSEGPLEELSGRLAVQLAKHAGGAGVALVAHLVLLVGGAGDSLRPRPCGVCVPRHKKPTRKISAVSRRNARPQRRISCITWA